MTETRHKPTLRVTKDYSLFELHPLNREISRTEVLEESMRDYGFDHGLPIRCIRAESGKLLITHGQHRFYVAKKLGIEVWYIVALQHIPLYPSEASAHSWIIRDYTVARTRDGEEAPAAALEFHQRTGIPLTCAISLVGGEGAGSYNKMKNVKTGTFATGDMKHANAVAAVVKHCEACGVAFAANSNFVRAISLCLLTPGFNDVLFCRKVRAHASFMKPRHGVDEYLDLFELIYNRRNAKKKMGVAFEAHQAAMRRKASFGRSQ